MASKAVIIAGLVLLIAAFCHAEQPAAEESRHLTKRNPLSSIIAGIGDGLKYIIDGLNIGTKGLITGLTYLFLGFFSGASNGLQKWRLGFYELFNAVVNLAQNVITFFTLSPLHSNFLGENHV